MTKKKHLNFDLDFLDGENGRPKKERKPKNGAKTSKSVKTEKREVKGEVSQVQPWHRWLARSIDSSIAGFAIGFILVIIAPDFLDKQDNISLSIITVFFLTFAEAFCLSKWGTTPGKRLFEISISDDNGKLPTYSKALKRSFLVWWRGLGIGIPFIAFFTQIIAYSKLKKNGITTWDSDLNFTVSHKKISEGRWFIAIIVMLIVFSLMVAGTASETTFDSYSDAGSQDFNSDFDFSDNDNRELNDVAGFACGYGQCPSPEGDYCIDKPDHAHCANIGTDAWLCDIGYREEGSNCRCISENYQCSSLDITLVDELDRALEELKREIELTVVDEYSQYSIDSYNKKVNTYTQKLSERNEYLEKNCDCSP